MELRKTRGPLLWLLAAIASLDGVFAAPPAVLLRYERVAGAKEHYQIEMSATVEKMGRLRASSRVAAEVAAVDAAGISIRVLQRVAGEGVPPADDSATFTLSRQGFVSHLASPQLGDGFHGACVRNLELLYLPMPAEPVSAGSSWFISRTLYIPETDGPVQIPPIAMAVKCRLGGYDGDAAQPIARVQVTARETEGAETRATITGTYRFDVKRSRVVSCKLSGEVTFFMMGLPMSFPVTLEVQELPAPAAR